VLRTGEPDIQQKCAGDEGRAGRHQHQHQHRCHEARLDLPCWVDSGAIWTVLCGREANCNE
jgi:hypothetical protein